MDEARPEPAEYTEIRDIDKRIGELVKRRRELERRLGAEVPVRP